MGVNEEELQEKQMFLGYGLYSAEIKLLTDVFQICFWMVIMGAPSINRNIKKDFSQTSH